MPYGVPNGIASVEESDSSISMKSRALQIFCRRGDACFVLL